MKPMAPTKEEEEEIPSKRSRVSAVSCRPSRPPPGRLVRTKEAQTGRKTLEPAVNPSLKEPE